MNQPAVEPLRHHADTPRAFGPRLRRIDPFLRREDRYSIFEAFRRRRTVHTRTLRAKFSHWSGISILSLPLILVLLLCTRFLALPLLLIWLVMAIARKATTRPDGCASAAGVLIRRNRHEPKLLLDLWMSGVRGGELAEAIALETANAQRYASTIFGAVVCIAGAIAAVAFARAGYWSGTGIMLCFGYFLWEVICQTWVASSTGPSRSLKERLTYMKRLASRKPIGQHILEQLMPALGIVILICGAFCIVGTVVGAIIEELLKSPAGVTVLRVTIASLFIGLGLWLRFSRRSRWIKACRKFFKAAREWDDVFDCFVRVAILNDNDVILGEAPALRRPSHSRPL